jgi:transposase
MSRPARGTAGKVGPLSLTARDRHLLEGWIRAPTSPQRVVRRSRIVLLLARGLSIRQVANELCVTRTTVLLWRARFEASGPRALTCDAEGRGRRPALSPDRLTLLEQLRCSDRFYGEDSVANLARRWGVSRATIFRARRRLADQKA